MPPPAKRSAGPSAQQYSNLLQRYQPTNRDLCEKTHLKLGLRLNKSKEETRAGYMYRCKWLSDDSLPCDYCFITGKPYTIRPLKRRSDGKIIIPRCLHCHRQGVVCSNVSTLRLKDWHAHRDRLRVARANCGDLPLAPAKSTSGAVTNQGTLKPRNEKASQDAVHKPPRPVSSAPSALTGVKAPPVRPVERTPLSRAGSVKNTEGDLGGRISHVKASREHTEPITLLDSDDDDDSEDEVKSGETHLNQFSSLGPSLQSVPVLSLPMPSSAPPSLPVADLARFKAYVTAGTQEVVHNPGFTGGLVCMPPNVLEARVAFDQWVLCSILENGIVPNITPSPNRNLYKHYIEWGVTAFMAGVAQVSETSGLTLPEIGARAPKDYERLMAYLDAVWPE